MNTPMRFMNDAVAVSWWMVEYCVLSSMQLLKGWSGRLTYSRRSSITSCAVSEATQRKGGDLHHTIYRQLGTTMLISSIYLVRAKDGSTDMKFNASCSFNCRRKNLSLIPSLAKRNGWLVLSKRYLYSPLERDFTLQWEDIPRMPWLFHKLVL